ncbi:KEOPS complex subunit Cgi121 [Halocatena marina]|uniref:KEOPS complex subunit Cgi121 n=1 Tax=Halocatena marina TaxID=2934937 RepID=A0ABD5YTI3_9EURY|nr:KEOPS complex subunit Cgi121 [Halocatena marina]
MQLLEGRATIDDVDAFIAQLGEIESEYETTVQAFDARYVVDRAHLERALALADRAIERGANVARERGVEILLYAAGRRQIDQALELGVSEGETEIVVLVDGDERAVEPVRSMLEPAATLGAYDESRVRSYFEISDAEIAATDATLSDLVRERVALLDVEK